MTRPIGHANACALFTNPERGECDCRRPRRVACAFCLRRMMCSLWVYEESPHCAKCLHERVALALARREALEATAPPRIPQTDVGPATFRRWGS